MPLFVKYKRGKRREGRTKVEWEEGGEVCWNAEKLSIPATLFYDESSGEKEFETKSVRLTVEKHLRNKKSTEMGYLDIELTRFVHQEEQKNIKVALTGGEFSGAILRISICAKETGDGNVSDDDGEEDEEDENDKDDSDEEDEEEDEEGKKQSEYKRPVKQPAPVQELSEETLEKHRSERRRRWREDQMCVLCMQHIPEFRCDECKQDLCSGCDAGLHSSPAMMAHQRQPLAPPPEPERKPKTQSRPGEMKSKGMKQKIDALCYFAKCDAEDAKRYLEEAEWNLDKAVALAEGGEDGEVQVAATGQAKKRNGAVRAAAAKGEEDEQARIQRERLEQQARVKALLAQQQQLGAGVGAGVGIGPPRAPTLDDIDDIEESSDEEEIVPGKVGGRPNGRVGREDVDEEDERYDAATVEEVVEESDEEEGQRMAPARRKEQTERPARYEGKDSSKDNGKDNGKDKIHGKVDKKKKVAFGGEEVAQPPALSGKGKGAKGGKGAKSGGDMFDNMLDALARPLQVSCGGDAGKGKQEGWLQGIMGWGGGKSSSESDSDEEDADSDGMPEPSNDFM
mmetsp:Transcript_38125/g.78194  ORF Transcript_38125/g.78194 Transcript_38125/m.78194 type:complete len:567 (+) Transcript_38125:530-2230(+)